MVEFLFGSNVEHVRPEKQKSCVVTIRTCDRTSYYYVVQLIAADFIRIVRVFMKA